jgi:tetratricopeptide (TPR) repeat protein
MTVSSPGVSVVDGAGFGVIGADLHVRADGTPLYRLTGQGRDLAADGAWLRALPSRMLNARFRVVDFTLREGELGHLHDWRRDAPPCSVRWLHGPGGQGKTRLADQFGAECALAGWRVVHAAYGAGGLHPLQLRRQDLRLDGAAGVLVIVDQADRWPLDDLVWLFGNRLVHQGVPTRILLVARSADLWPRVRALLADGPFARSDQLLSPLYDGRQRGEMFDAARDGFAARYGIADPSAITAPGPLEDPDMGLTLGLHLAALVAVDAYAEGRTPPHGMEALTIYLLEREQSRWASLSGRGHGTAPALMNRVVFTAALTGALPQETALTLLDRLRVDVDAGKVLDDHAACYPAIDGGVLEPLYPDRLAEDFLALTLPGHAAAYPSGAWAPTTATAVLTGGRDRTPWLPRAMTLLVAAADRWPHVGERHLFPLLRRQPQLLLAAGGAALADLARLDAVDPEILLAVEPLLPRAGDVWLDVGVAAVAERLTLRRLATVEDPVERARLLDHLGWRYTNAGRQVDALRSAEQAVAVLRAMPPRLRKRNVPVVARTTAGLGAALAEVGRWADALAATTDAVVLLRELAKKHPEAHRPELAVALRDAATQLAELGRPADALGPARESLSLYRLLATGNPDAYVPAMATAMTTLGRILVALDHQDEALSLAREAAELRRQSAGQGAETTGDPAAAAMLAHRAGRLWGLGRRDEAVAEAQAAVDRYRPPASDQPGRYGPELALALANLGKMLLELGRPEAVDALGESAHLRRELADRDPAAHLTSLTYVLSNFAIALHQQNRPVEAFSVMEEAVGRHRVLGERVPSPHWPTMAMALTNLAVITADVRGLAAALDPAQEAVAFYRSLAAEDPGTYRAVLSGALQLLARLFAAAGQPGEAAAAATEAAGLIGPPP